MAENETKSIQIPKRLEPWEDIVLDLRELVEEAKRRGEAEAVIGDVIFEDVKIKGEDDYEEYIHEEIPELMRRILRFLRFREIVIYHKKDDIRAPEYLVETMRGRTPYVFEIEVSYHNTALEWEISWVRVVKDAKINEDYLPYYHEV